MCAYILNVKIIRDQKSENYKPYKIKIVHFSYFYLFNFQILNYNIQSMAADFNILIMI